jgi:short-subunit dehydrogenase
VLLGGRPLQSKSVKCELTHSLVAITGASSGIGAVFARKLAADYDLLLIARRKDRLEELARELELSRGTRVEVLEADLCLAEDLEKVATRLAGDPRLVMLINNAGFGSKGRFWEAPLETQTQMHQLHVMAAMRLTHAALGNMVPRDLGAVINVASVASFVRSQGSVSYCATKAWMTAFTEGLYLELKGLGSQVLVQALCPGFTYSEFHDTMAVSRSALAGPKFWLRAEDVVDASLEGLRRGKLFVIPGWRYRVLLAVLTKLPSSVRVALEAKSGKARIEAKLESPN